MADFRKWVPVLVVLALLIGAASTASAQATPSITCVNNAGVPPLLRAEGLTELAGDIVLNCSGNAPTPAFQNFFNVNVQVTLNTNITSRILGGDTTEALLLLDEPVPSATMGTNVLTTSSVCPGTNFQGCVAPGTATTPSIITPSTINAVRGRMVPGFQNAVGFYGVPIIPPGSGTRVIRITNIRANAAQLGASSSLVPTSVIAYISISGSTSIAVNNPQQVVGQVQQSYLFDVTNCSGGGVGTNNQLFQCATQNRDAFGNPGANAAQGSQFAVRFRETFPTAFRIREAFASRDAGGAITGGVDQDPSIPGLVYNTESGFINRAVLGGNTGTATNPTRFVVRFSNLPASVRVRVARFAQFGSIGAQLITGADANGNGGSSFFGTIGTSFCPLTGGSYNSIQIPVGADGTAIAIYEVFSSNPFQYDSVVIPVEIDYISGAGTPPLGTSNVAGGYAPYYTVSSPAADAAKASGSLPIPRFIDTTQSGTAFRITACQTNILFPYVTTDAGFDSGIAIANTTKDIYGTAPQDGACDLNYFPRGGGATTKETSAVVNNGDTLVLDLYAGGTHSLKGTGTGFTGYIIARCNFQYGHGFAFISDLGANRLAEGYVPLILDSQVSSVSLTGSMNLSTGSISLGGASATPTRTGVANEGLAQ